MVRGICVNQRSYFKGKELMIEGTTTGYRVLLLPKEGRPYKKWFSNHGSTGGRCGIFSNIQDLRNGVRVRGIKKGTYEIWKIYIGLDPEEWFPPEQVE